MVAVCLPFLVNFLRLNVALPLALVLAVYFLPFTLIVTFAFAIDLPDLDFNVTVYFLVFVLALKVFFLAVNFDASLLTLTVAVALAALYVSSPSKLIVAFKDPVFAALSETVATPLLFVFALWVAPLKMTTISFPAIAFPLASLRVIW